MMNGTLICHYTLEQQTKQWSEADYSAPKKAKSIPSVEKVNVSVFWGSTVFASFTLKRIQQYSDSIIPMFYQN